MVSDSHQGGTSSAEDRVTCHRPDSLKSMHRCFSTRLMVTEEWLHHTTLACSIYVFFFFFKSEIGETGKHGQDILPYFY